MSVFLTPDRRPFYAGTYFPPDAAARPAVVPRRCSTRSATPGPRAATRCWPAPRRSRPSWPAGGRSWPRTRSASRSGRRAGRAGPGVRPDPRRLRRGPPSSRRPWCWRRCCGYGDDPRPGPWPARRCEAMARGGIYDQLAGGFARYSVDAGWVVPHFEKMLYDNALLLGVYTHWWRRDRRPAGRAGGRRDGRLAAGRDADRARAGSPPAWTPTPSTSTATSRGRLLRLDRRTSCVEALGRGRRRVGGRGRSRSPPAGTFEHGLSTLQLPADPEPERLGRVRDRLAAGPRPSRPAGPRRQGRRRLERLADRLPGPGRRCSSTGRTGSRPRARRPSALAGALARTAGCAGPPGTAWSGTAAGHPGGLRGAGPRLRPAGRGDRRPGVDRAGRRRCSRWCRSSSTTGDGGFFDTAADAEPLYTRPQDPTDNATPSGLSSAVHALALLAELTGETGVRRPGRAGRAAAPARLVARAPRFAGWLLADAVSRIRATPGPGRDRRARRTIRAGPTWPCVAARLAPGRFGGGGRRAGPAGLRAAGRPAAATTADRPRTSAGDSSAGCRSPRPTDLARCSSSEAQPART